MKNLKNTAFAFFLVVLGWSMGAYAQESPTEEDYFRIMKVSAPEGTLLEVGGLTVMPNGNLGVATRRGDIYIVENPTSARPFFRKFASGLHEVLGLRYVDGSFYCAQRGELTKLTDTNQDGKADLYETVYAWPVSGHYHEYSYGPVIDEEGNFYVSGNLAFGIDGQWWRGDSRVPYRGWVMKISPDGQMEPWATGMRSPAGLGHIDGKLFYTENQGDYMATGGIWHVKKGAFVGHPGGLQWTNLSNSPLSLTMEAFNKVVDPRLIKDDQGRYIKPENMVEEEYITMYQAKEQLPDLTLPAVWFPYGIQGISTSEPIKIPEGHFGPFAGQLLVGDQGQSKIMRVALEEVKGELQGVAIDFRSNFRSGVLRMAWGQDKSLFVGETNRGWGSAGDANEGLERLVWNGEVPFEMRTVKAMPDGFEIEFTKPVDRKSAEDLASYSVQTFIYKYHPVYGSPPVANETASVQGVKVSADGLKARIKVDGLKQYHIHHILLDGVREKDTYYSLVHPSAYYTLNNIPDGAALAANEMSTFNSSVKQEEAQPKNVTPKALAQATQTGQKQETKAVKETVDEDLIKTLLSKHTCIACHNKDTKQVGPAYKDVAKRDYSAEKIVELIHTPEPQNWPEYATPMPPMPHVPKEDALKIAQWINTLK
ncbi:c-type cytochrome [Negadavirga shengliensis]|uniref:C-type cytochrome n=1 Tax=Negadavirga shengliensis TaxID=1389218 RepID=A0ABV9T1R9_9BACT